MGENNRRREIQIAHNKKHGITPKTTYKAIGSALENLYKKKGVEEEKPQKIPTERELHNLKKEMLEAAANLEFEKASELRDQVKAYEKMLLI